MMYPWLNSAWREYLQRITVNRLHHGILMVGKQGLGKAQLAANMARHLLCQNHQTSQNACGQCKACLLNDAGTHPDLTIISEEKSIGVDQIRQAIAKLNSSAQLSGNKVLVIENMTSMTESAANALLKTLEEPTAKTFILMTCSETEKLLPTILSRCSRINIAPPDHQTCYNWLIEEGIQVEPKQVAMFNKGPLLLKDMLLGEGLNFEGFMAALKAMLMGQITVKSFAEEQLDDTGLNWLSNWLLQRAKKQPEYLTLLEKVAQTKQQLSHTGVNRALLCSKLCIDIKQLLVK